LLLEIDGFSSVPVVAGSSDKDCNQVVS